MALLGIVLSFDGVLTRALQSPPLRGRLTTPLKQILLFVPTHINRVRHQIT